MLFPGANTLSYNFHRRAHINAELQAGSTAQVQRLSIVDNALLFRLPGMYSISPVAPPRHARMTSLVRPGAGDLACGTGGAHAAAGPIFAHDNAIPVVSRAYDQWELLSFPIVTDDRYYSTRRT